MKNAVLQLEAIFATAIDAMVVTDMVGNIEMFNTAAEQMFGYLSQEVIGMNVNLLMPMPDSLHHHLYMERYVKTRQSRIPRLGREVIAKRRNGDTFFADITITDVDQDDGIIFIAIIRDISVRKIKEQQVVQLAFFDQETGLPNAYYLRDKLDHLLKEQVTDYHLISLYLGDLSDYINIFGVHGVKDVIVAISNLLNDKLPLRSLVVRCGLRHLKIIYAPARGESLSTEQIAKQIQTIIGQLLHVSSYRIFLTATFGIIKIEPQKHTVEMLFDHVDVALHIAKRNISNNYEIFKTQFIDTLHRRALVVQKLYNAMNEMPFQLYLQPQVSLTTQHIVGVEALIRWQDTDGTWISPAEFIPIAETIGLIKDITLWTLKKTCAIVNHWKKINNQCHTIAINISAQVLCSPTFLQEMTVLITDTGIDPKVLELEITETALMLSLDTAISTVTELSALGMSISIDDFGTGLSSLAYLKLFKINRLKIDKSFVTYILDDTHDQKMVTAIIKLAHELGYQVVCEGIENKAQLTLLQELGCDEVQGYYLAKPMPSTEFLDFAENFIFE